MPPGCAQVPDGVLGLTAGGSGKLCMLSFVLAFCTRFSALFDTYFSRASALTIRPRPKRFAGLLPYLGGGEIQWWCTGALRSQQQWSVRRARPARKEHWDAVPA